MNSEFISMFKKVLMYDVVIAIMFTVVIYLISKVHALFFILGLIIAIVSFFINGYIVNYTLGSTTKNNKVIMLLGFLSRVLLICLVGIIIAKFNKYGVLTYVLGYSSQFISLVLYGIKIKN